MTPTRAATQNVGLAAPENAIAAAPDNERVGSLPVETARCLMALPPEIRNTLRVVCKKPESTEQQLTELTSPTGALDAIKRKQERLGEDLEKLSKARDALTANGRFEEADCIDEPLALLTECFNLLSHECDIRLAGDTLVNRYRDLGTLLQTARISYSEGRQRIQPTPPGGAPDPRQSLPALSDEKVAALDIHLQHALATHTRDELISHLATLIFELNRSSSHPDCCFLAWFSARAVLETRQLSAPDLLDSKVFREMQDQEWPATEIQQTLAQTRLLSLDNQAICQLAQVLSNARLAKHSKSDPITDCLNRPELLPLGNLPEPLSGAPDDPAWDFAQTPPASPRA